jgi:shikimate kinase
MLYKILEETGRQFFRRLMREALETTVQTVVSTGAAILIQKMLGEPEVIHLELEEFEEEEEEQEEEEEEPEPPPEEEPKKRKRRGRKYEGN